MDCTDEIIMYTECLAHIIWKTDVTEDESDGIVRMSVVVREWRGW